jgi:hypothetical protein
VPVSAATDAEMGRITSAAVPVMPSPSRSRTLPIADCGKPTLARMTKHSPPLTCSRT